MKLGSELKTFRKLVSKNQKAKSVSSWLSLCFLHKQILILGVCYMSKVEIFDPALCCSTGVCGPSVDPELVRVATAIFLLEKKGCDIKRYNLGFEPAKFVENNEVHKVLNEKGPDSLPITLVEDKVAKIGTYPTNEELAEWFGVKPEDLTKQTNIRHKLI
jgi:hypothetical protein